MCGAHMKSTPRAYVSKVLCPRKQIVIMPLALIIGTNSVLLGGGVRASFMEGYEHCCLQKFHCLHSNSYHRTSVSCVPRFVPNSTKPTQDVRSPSVGL